ncbi:MAG: hypothetical protein K9H49_14085 [Bacteroidales bacterium]|nr:hypothetical protein [Bacteroidales bacterium]MCF8390823.1 hypothetical protein [Bacteroidales bacterium]
MKKIILLLPLVMTGLLMFGQEQFSVESETEKTNELGAGIGMSYIKNEGLWAPGFHLHYGKSIDKKQRISIGAGLEFLLDEHVHTSVVLALGYNITPCLYLGYGVGIDPAIIFDGDNKFKFDQHLELAYEFDLDFIHLGPMIEYGLSKEDQHYMLGVHGGFTF